MTEKDKGTTKKRETLYVVKAESKQGANETAYEILERLIMRKAAEEKEGASGTPLSILQYLIENYARENLNGRTCCLDTNGGKTNVGTNGNE